MMTRVQVAAAVLVGYWLGRGHRKKLGILLAAAGAGRLAGGPQEMVDRRDGGPADGVLSRPPLGDREGRSDDHSGRGPEFEQSRRRRRHILDKGLVIGFAEAVNRLEIGNEPEGLADLVSDVKGSGSAKAKTKGALAAVGESLGELLGGSGTAREPAPRRASLTELR